VIQLSLATPQLEKLPSHRWDGGHHLMRENDHLLTRLKIFAQSKVLPCSLPIPDWLVPCFLGEVLGTFPWLLPLLSVRSVDSDQVCGPSKVTASLFLFSHTLHISVIKDICIF
jgi:hypothetical protein